MSHTFAADGLLALYDFGQPSSGNVILDRSGRPNPIQLEIKTPERARVEGGVLTLQRDARVEASASDTKRLIRDLRKTNSLSIAVWLKAADKRQSGPARLVTISGDTSNRNVTLGQDGDKVDVRLRTSKSDRNGLPSTKTKIASIDQSWTHLVFTRRSSGDTSIYVNGKRAESSKREGSFDSWDDRFQLILGNENGGSRSWRGQLSLVAIYNRVLSDKEVRAQHQRGHQAKLPSLVSTKPDRKELARQHFEQRIAPLLSKNCLACHDAASNEGGVDLSHKQSAFVGGDSGVAIVPGKPEQSLVWTSVESDEMPHDRPPLTDEEKRLLKDWIFNGATWPVEFVDPAVYRNAPNPERWISRLTVDEYIQTVQATFGVDIAEAANDRLPPDLRADGFRNTAYNLMVDFGHVSAYADLSEIVIDKVDVARFAKRFTKQRTMTDRNMRPMIEAMGKIVLRGPLTGEETALYRGISTTVALSGGGFDDAVAYVLRAMMQSPRFLYRIENANETGRLSDPYEIANRLSYTVWGGPPDAELFRAADDGELFDDEQLKKQLERMWLDEHAVRHSIEFATQWLHLDRLNHLNPDRERYPDWNNDLADDMRRETIDTFRDWVWEQKGSLVELLNLSFTYATPRLAAHYGMKPKSDPWARYDLGNESSRGGLLTHGSLLTIGGDDASMVTRGLFVLNDLLFSEVGDPPPGLDTSPVPTAPGRTHRMVATDRIESEACGGCHKRFEPLAFALEKYDGLGSFHHRDEHGNELREDGEILFPGDARPTKYKTTAEMMQLLAASDRVAECLTRKVIQFGLGRPLDSSDAAMVAGIHRHAGGNAATYQSIVSELLLSVCQ